MIFVRFVRQENGSKLTEKRLIEKKITKTMFKARKMPWNLPAKIHRTLQALK